MNHIYDFLAPILGVSTAGALLLSLIFLFRGAIRKYWIIAVYVVWELLAEAAVTIADVILHGSSAEATHSAANRLYARIYWTSDVLDDLFRFVLVIVMIYWSSAGSKRVSGRLLALLVLLMIVLPFVIFDPQVKPAAISGTPFPFPSATWFNSTSELLNFGAAIMNLLLWAGLIASKQRDPQLLAVSAGLGVVVTGTALAYGLRHLTGPTQFGAVAALFLNLTQLAGWSIWCWAFRPVRKPHPLSGTISSS